MKQFLLRSTMIGALAVSGSAWAETIVDAVNTAVHSNPIILESVANTSAINDELRQAKGRYRPTISLSADTGAVIEEGDSDRYSNTYSTQGNGRIVDDQKSWKSGASVRLTQNLFDGGSRKAEEQRQAARVDSSSIRIVERAEAIALQTIYAYLEVLRYQENMHLSAKNVAKHREIVNRVENLGAITASAADVAQARSRLARAEDNYVIVTRNLEENALAFERLVGRRPGDLEKPQLVSEQALPATVEDAKALTIAKNPTLQFSRVDIDVAKAELKSTEANFYPTLNLELEGGVSNNAGGGSGTQRNASASVLLNWNIYNGNVNDATYDEYKNRLVQSEENYNSQQRFTIEETLKTWDLLVRDDARIQSLRQEVRYSAEALRTYNEEFEAGNRDLLDVLQAESDSYVSKINLLEAEYSKIYNRYRLLAMTGNLLDYLGVQVNFDQVGMNARDKSGIAYTNEKTRYNPKNW